MGCDFSRSMQHQPIIPIPGERLETARSRRYYLQMTAGRHLSCLATYRPALFLWTPRADD